MTNFQRYLIERLKDPEFLTRYHRAKRELEETMTRTIQTGSTQTPKTLVAGNPEPDRLLRPCLCCGAPIDATKGCKGPCPNCGTPYPAGDCSD